MTNKKEGKVAENVMGADSKENSRSGSSSSNGIATNELLTGKMPKHIPFPELPSSSELLNEFIMFIFVTSVAGMQFINIYRTNWWIPNSYVHHVVNFYLIEPYLVALILLITARRLIYCLLTRALEHSHQYQRVYRRVLRYSFGTILMILLGYCVVKIYMQHSYMSLFLLVYPLIVYLLIFGFKIEPFLCSTCEVEGAYFNGMPMHCCSTTPSTIRDEIEMLKNDFNNRFKQVIFTSVLNAYYAGFVPCFFAVSIYYNVLWATQHIIFVWLSGFTMTIAFVLPSKYSDILHRASLHLGYWCRSDVRPTTTNSNGAGGGLVNASPATWNKSVVWSHGTVVKHNGEMYRCLGPVTVAQPGNSSHSRFYRLFHDPSIIYMILTTVQAAIVLAEIILLYFTIEWHFILSISFITLTNQFTFFKIMRDYLITKRIYEAEKSIADNKNTNSSLHLN